MEVGVLITALLGVGAIIATLVAPRLITRPRISVERSGITRLDTEHAYSEVELRAVHKGQVITKPVFLFTVTMENTGSRDITAEHFVKPIYIRLERDSEIISTSISAPDGVDVDVERLGAEVRIRWDILKPREHVSATVVCQYNGAKLNRKYVERCIESNARLKDVTEGKRIPWVKIFSSLGSALAFIAVLYLPFTYGNVDASSWVLTDSHSGTKLVIVPGDVANELRLCKVDAKFWRHDCIRLSEAQARDLVTHAKIQRVADLVDYVEDARGALFTMLAALCEIICLGLLVDTPKLVRLMANMDTRTKRSDRN